MHTENRQEAVGPAHWDLATFFPDEPSPERFLSRLRARIDDFAYSAAGEASELGRTIAAYEEIEIGLRHLEAYVLCLQSADVEDADAPKLQAWLDRARLDFQARADGLLRALALLDTQEAADVGRTLKGDDGPAKLEELRSSGRSLLAPQDERLLANFEAAAFESWGRWALRQHARGVLEFADGSGRVRETAHALKAAALADADPVARHGAYEAMRTWAARRREAFACATNARVGARLAICERRGTAVRMETAARNRISERTLVEFMAAVKDGRARVWRYGPLKARALGLPSLRLCDRTAVLPAASGPVDFEMLTSTLDDALRAVWPAMADSAARVRRMRWLDGLPRERKGSVGICVWSPINGEPRVLTAFDGSLASAVIFAHEHGHAFHGEQLTQVRASLREAPSAIAETFAVLAEQIFRDGLVAAEEPAFGGRKAALASELDSALNYLVRVPRDYEAELAIHTARSAGELSPDDLCEISRGAFRDWLAPCLEASDEDEYLWINNGFYYLQSFFNWPYTFAYVAASYLNARLREDPAEAARLQTLIRAAALGDVDAAFMSAFGVDVASDEFVTPAFARVDRRLDALAPLLAG